MGAKIDYNNATAQCSSFSDANLLTRNVEASVRQQTDLAFETAGFALLFSAATASLAHHRHAVKACVLCVERR